ncbi:hypothetical protein LEP1GSC067_0643 [Leptospira interrogans serovar Lora str. TE 1992]|uniref:Uncharacterized protein n=1 Tax=Leptospira interrogans serovar Lora str. TE 1992 TaxID=1193028 RepID=M3CR95_LEPIR|nr:hypothetical protein LEP1GSC087_1517 [Leptospira interrogans serovar Bataviae str. L1111]EMF44119.1 hypothetical protein LEP1GSC067_0643 [Leptospira interrogans serovar Lora str. TE 1992]
MGENKFINRNHLFLEWIRFLSKIGSAFSKVVVPTYSRLNCKIVICSSSHVFKIEL